MDPTNYIINLFTPEGFFSLVSLLVLVLQYMYAFFAFLITRQVSLMNKSLSTPAARLFLMLSTIHFIVSLIFVAVATLSIL